MSSKDEDVFMIYVEQMVYLGLVAIAIVWVVTILFSFTLSFGDEDKSINNPIAIEQRLQAIEVVKIKEEPKAVAADPKAAEGSSSDETAQAAADSGIDGANVYNSVCAACHGTGILNAPKLGDIAAWEARIQANGDFAGLVKSAIVGKGAMPARGGNAALSDAEVQAAIEHMMK